jgi:hypothetical protein
MQKQKQRAHNWTHDSGRLEVQIDNRRGAKCTSERRRRPSHITGTKIKPFGLAAGSVSL